MEHGTIAKVTSSGQFDDDPLKVAWKIDEMITERRFVVSNEPRLLLLLLPRRKRDRRQITSRAHDDDDDSKP